jgi:hypothetical protein
MHSLQGFRTRHSASTTTLPCAPVSPNTPQKWKETQIPPLISTSPRVRREDSRAKSWHVSIDEHVMISRGRLGNRAFVAASEMRRLTDAIGSVRIWRIRYSEKGVWNKGAAVWKRRQTYRVSTKIPFIPVLALQPPYSRLRWQVKCWAVEQTQTAASSNACTHYRLSYRSHGRSWPAVLCCAVVRHKSAGLRSVSMRRWLAGGFLLRSGQTQVGEPKTVEYAQWHYFASRQRGRPTARIPQLSPENKNLVTDFRP